MPERREDRRMVMGAATFGADIELPHMAHAAFVRSPVACGEIVGIDVPASVGGADRGQVFTSATMPPWMKPIRAPYVGHGYVETGYPPLAAGRVRFVGEAVAVAVAESPGDAARLARRVQVEYDPLPAVVDVWAALAEGAPAIHQELSGNCYVDESASFGDVDGARQTAVGAVEETFRTQRLAGAPMECRSIVAAYERGYGRLTVWLGTAVPHVIRYGLAECLGLDERLVRVIVPEIGGSFGNKTSLYPEDVVVCALAMSLGRPIRWVESRYENLVASTHGQEEEIWARLSADAEGHLLSLECSILINGGAYSSYPDTPCNEALNCAQSIVGPYRLSNYRYRTRAVATNTCPNGAYRGVARPGANFAMERLVDKLAFRLGMSPVELRRRNLVAPEEMPYRTVTGLERDSGEYAKCLELAEAQVSESGLSRPAPVEALGRWRVGVGFSCFAEEGAWGTVRRIPRGAGPIAGFDGASIRMDPRARVTVATSAVSSGQGHETVFARLAAEVLGIPEAWVLVRAPDTDIVPYGHGSTGSRSSVSAGGALILAARRLRERLVELAAADLQVESRDLTIADGVIRSVLTGDALMEVEQVARQAYRKKGPAPTDLTAPGLEFVEYYDPPANGVSSFSCHVAVVAVDLDTGRIMVQKYVVVEDTGVMLDVRGVEGQLRGGVAQGIGKALYEHMQYSEEGQPLTPSLGDYLIPAATEIGRVTIVHLSTPSPLTVGGIKGCGESGVIGVAAAVGNAIADALQTDKGGCQLPFSPEAVWRWTELASAHQAGVTTLSQADVREPSM